MSIKNNPSVRNRGYIGEGLYPCYIENKPSKQYNAWSKIINRCYSEKVHLRQPKYTDCVVDPRWLDFQIFAKWFDENYIEGYALDKDILVKGNKVYGPDTCCFVPSSINNLFTKREKDRGELPIGVMLRKDSGKLRSQFHKNGKTVNIGQFNTIDEAFNAYKIAKEIHIKELAEIWKDKISNKTYHAMIKYEVDIED
jgi:hypothetical protein